MATTLAAIGLLVLSNVFMTFAWYGHLGGAVRPTSGVMAYLASLKERPWMLAVLVSWGIALVEYVFQVPANRIGSETLTKAQLKIVQEVISLAVFAVIAITYWREPLGWNYVWATGCIVAAVFFVFRPDGRALETNVAAVAPETRADH